MIHEICNNLGIKETLNLIDVWNAQSERHRKSTRSTL